MLAELAAVLALAGPGVDYPGCNTRRCVKRVQARAHRRTVRRWSATARPYAGWLAKVRQCESGGRYRSVLAMGFMGRISSRSRAGGRSAARIPTSRLAR